MVFRSSELFRSSDATLWIQVRVIRDWRFRVGLWLVRIGANLMGLKVEDVEVRVPTGTEGAV